MATPPLDDKVRAAVSYLVEHHSPLAIFFYGSRARGAPRPNSDYDFYVVVPDEGYDGALSAQVAPVASRELGFKVDTLFASLSGFLSSYVEEGSHAQRAYRGIIAYPGQRDLTVGYLRFLSMGLRTIEAPDAPSAAGGYAQAAEVIGARRLLFVSGQIPVTSKGHVPEGFEEQALLVWSNVQAQLRAAGMTLANVVKVTTFLSDRRYADQNREVREGVLGTSRPALTVIITGIFHEAWLREIEVVAAAE